jgi:hypothetical protein
MNKIGRNTKNGETRVVCRKPVGMQGGNGRTLNIERQYSYGEEIVILKCCYCGINDGPAKRCITASSLIETNGYY